MRIGIIGQGITIERENLDWSIEDLVFYSVRNTLNSSNFNIDEIDTVVQAGDDIMDGIAINHVYTIEPAGAFLKEESKVERDGAWAVHYAIARLMSGKFKTAMVVAFSKASQCTFSAFSGHSADPFYMRPLGADGNTIAALQAGYFSERTGMTQEDFASVAVKNRKAGIENPRVIQGEAGEFSIEDVLSSSPISTPITELTTGRSGDGCVVMILATEEYIKERNLNAIYITGAGFISDAYYPTFRDFSRIKSAEAAAQIAYKMAGFSPESADLAEVYELFAHQELMLYEALGICNEGEASNLLKEGRTARNGDIPVNPSGGVLCGHIVYASGLARMMEAVLQLSGEAGTQQIENAKSAIVHAQAGLAMQSNIVYVLEA